MAVELDRVGLLGSGTAPEPRGVANTLGVGTFAVDAPLVGYGDLLRARTAVLSANQNPRAIVLHPRDEGAFVSMMDSTGQPLMMPRALEAILSYSPTLGQISG